MTPRSVLALGLAAVAHASACVPDFLDIYGVDSVVTENASNPEEPEDDRIEDKHPEYDPARVVVETFDHGCRFSLNKSATVTKLDIAPLEGEDRELAGRIFGTRADAFADLDPRTDDRNRLIPSMEVVNGALKPFNDGLYAAIELGAQAGVTVDSVEVYPGKRAFLEDLLASVLALAASATPTQAAYLRDAAADLGAALRLGGATPALPADVEAQAEARAAAFEAEPLISRPVGFYTWRPELGQIFRQDRFLQNDQVQHPVPRDPYSDAEIGKAAALALALRDDADLLDRYEGYLALYAGLTNPFANLPVTVLLPYLTGLENLDDLGALRSRLLADHPPPSLPDGCQPHFALFPSSRSRETTYFDERYCASGVPSGVNLMDELIDAIREGRIDLEPDPDSGWYDYQTYALETLLLPERGGESQHLLLTAAYKKKLMDTFRSILTQNRETHVRQLETGGSMATAVPPTRSDIYPLFPVEPFPTFYLRTARAYRFLGTYLAAVLGPDFLAHVRRETEDGTTGAETLDAELRAKAALLYGLHDLAADAVGMAPELLPEETAEFPEADCRAAAQAWLANWRADADVARDPRVIVPVQIDPATGDVVYWTIPGVRAIKARAEFVEGYEPRDVRPVDGDCEAGDIVPMEYYLVVEAFAEVRIPSTTPPPTRDEFRAICDAYDTVEEIVAALEAL